MRVWLLAALVLLTVPASAQAQRQEGEALVPSSPFVVVADPAGARLFVADATREGVFVFDLESRTATPLPIEGFPPTGLAVAPNGDALYVTSTASGGRVVRFDLGTKKPASPEALASIDPIASVAAGGPFPTAPVVSPDGRTLWVCNRFAHRIEAYDASTLTLRARIDVPREPIAAALTPDGKRLCVGQHLPEGSADGHHVATALHVIDVEASALLESIDLPNGSTSLLGLCVSPDGRHAFATHILARYTVPTTQIERGWINTNALSIVDLEELELLGTVLLDDVGLGAANPWGVTCTPDGGQLLVTHAGSHELSVIDLPALLAKLEALDESSANEVGEDLTFLASLRRRVRLEGKGPRGLTVAGGQAWVAEYFSGSLGSYALPGGEYARSRSFPLMETAVAPTPERRGELLFFDATICHQQWQSCASCHPDARTDALNWDLLNDGFGNPKNTRSMLLAHRTPPAMATGKRGDAEAAVRAGIRHILFTVRPEEDAVAIDAYLRSLRPVRSPESLRPENRDAIARGAAVYEKARCSDCHVAPLYTDLKPYDVGTGRGGDEGRAFDTPTLIEIWRTAPYLHDGRAADLRSVLTEHNAGDRHGSTSDLTEQELTDLVLFLRSL